MMITQLLREYADYDLWANERFVQRLEREPDAILDQELRSSFPSIRSTILHIRNAEHTWWCRITGNKGSWPAEADERIGNLMKHSAILRAHVHALDEAGLLAEHTYHDLKGNAHVQPVWRMLMHCFNHSTQHRGQLITMMRSLGLDGIPANDMVVYQRTLAQ